MNYITGRRAAAIIAMTVCANAAAQSSYPSKQVTLVVPFPAGGITDMIARPVAKELSASWKQPVIVDNKPGASGLIGTEYVARAPKDGYTMLFTITSHVQLPALRERMPYDALKDFEPVTQVALSSSMLAVSAKFPVESAKQLVAKVKAEPEKHAYGSYGAGTTSNIYGELFKKEAGVSLTHVPYKGAGPVTNDLVAGVLNVAFLDVGTAMPHIKAGKIKPLAIIGTQRSELLPEVPTFQELGYKGFEPCAWMGLLMPSGTPKEIVSKVAADVRQIVKAPEMERRLKDANLEPVANTPAEFAAVLRQDSETWRRVIKLGGVTAE